MHVLLRLSACRTLESSPYGRVTPAEKPAAPASRRITPPTSHSRGAPSNGNRFWEKRKPLPHTVTETRGRGHRNPGATANGNQQGAGRRLLCSHCRGPKADPPLARPEVDKTQMKISMHWGTHPGVRCYIDMDTERVHTTNLMRVSHMHAVCIESKLPTGVRGGR